MNDGSRSDQPCHVCGEAGLEEFGNFSCLPRVTSDCQPWGPGGHLAICPQCATVQKFTDSEWRAEAQDIYARYQIYAQSGGDDQAVFDQSTGESTGRSMRLLACALESVELPSKGRWLDVGCGNGALLSALSSQLPEWRLTGAEIGESHRQQIEALPNVESFHGDGLESVGGRFNVISMVHVLEHIENPVRFLADVCKFLKPDGYLLIEVPCFADNPFDLLIADHCTHFMPESLTRVLAGADLDVVTVTSRCIKREMTAWARLGDANSAQKTLRASGSETQNVADVTRRCVKWLRAVGDELKALAQKGQFGIFGSSIAACIVDQISDSQAAYFVDEDPSRIGRTYLHRPIVAPSDVERNASIYVALPHPLAETIAKRLNSESHKYFCPPRA